jgi:hypothetical protein
VDTLFCQIKALGDPFNIISSFTYQLLPRNHHSVSGLAMPAATSVLHKGDDSKLRMDSLFLNNVSVLNKLNFPPPPPPKD